MTSKSASLVALVSGVVIGAQAHAQPAPGVHDSNEPHDGITESAERQPGSTRVEASTSAGTDAARHAELRASARRGSVDLSLTGGVDDRADRQQRGAVVAIDRASGTSRLAVTGGISDVALDLAIASVGIQTRSGGAAWSSGRIDLGNLDHELVIGASFTSTSGMSTDTSEDLMHMGVLQRERRSDHRFLQAYLKDTLHVIETLDVSGGFVFDDWRNLSAIETIRYGTDEQMDVHAPHIEDMHFSPQLGALYRATDHIAVRASGYRELRAPTVGELYVPLVLDGAVAAANAQLTPESVWAGEVGPELRIGHLQARSAAFLHEIDSPIASANGERTNLDHGRVLGVATEASWRPVEPVLAAVSYTRSSSTIRDAAYAGHELSLVPRHRAAALLSYDARRVATLSGGVRWLGRQYIDAENTRAIRSTTLVDATATRAIRRGLAGYVSVENLLDRRTIAAHDLPAAGRTVQIGVKLDSARF
ncbi:MAG TPA: TonB-dependent receptor [Kofleriaceae bacterium]|nr:TonB-dependent receptor [Kofleriaceae bacterium]